MSANESDSSDGTGNDPFSRSSTPEVAPLQLNTPPAPSIRPDDSGDGVREMLKSSRWHWPDIGWDRTGTMQKYIFALESKGNAALVDLLVKEDENASNDALPQHQLSKFQRAPDLLRAKADAAVILSSLLVDTKARLLQGNLMSTFPSRQLREDTAELPKHKDSVNLPSKVPATHNRPCIYSLLLANSQGKNPTKREMEKVISVVEMYIKEAVKFSPAANDPDSKIGLHPRNYASNHSDDELNTIRKVDEWQPLGQPSWINHHNYQNRPDKIKDRHRRGARRYIQTSQTKEHVEIWIRAMRSRLALIAAQHQDLPIPWAIAHVGWTLDPQTRLTSHRNHTNSNRIMNLVEAAIGVVINSANPWVGFDDYRMRPMILYNVPADELVDMGEHIFSLLLRSYVWQGGLNAEVGGVHTSTKDTTYAVLYTRWEKKMQQTQLKQIVRSVRQEGRRLEENWTIMKAVLDSEMEQAEHRCAVKKVNTSQDQLKRALDKQSEISSAVEQAVVPFVKKAREDFNTAVAAREVRGMIDELIDVMRLLNVNVEPTRMRRDRLGYFRAAMDHLLQHDRRLAGPRSLDAVVRDVNSRIDVHGFATAEAILMLRYLSKEASPTIVLDEVTNTIRKA